MPTRRRSHARPDPNQAAIVKALRANGCSVEVTADIGGGFPDLVVGRRGRTFLLEVKKGYEFPPSERALTSDQVVWHGRWLGQVAVVHNVGEALAAVGVISIG